MNEEYRKSLKSMDTEETFDLIFYRPIGYVWAVMAKKSGITPNMITVASIFIGIGAGVCFFFNPACSPGMDYMWWNLLGMLLLILANSFDSADGQLARMTGQYSQIGRILDGVCGDLWFIAIYAGICMREDMSSAFFGAHHGLIWIIAAVTGFFHLTQAVMSDYYRQFHLYFLRGARSELDSSFQIRNEAAGMSWKREPFKKLFTIFYGIYTSAQEGLTPNMQRFRAELAERYGGNIPEEVCERFRKESKPLMKYTNILTFNTRSFALFIAILVFRRPWLYFAFELTVLNCVLIYMIVRHERICRNLSGDLN